MHVFGVIFIASCLRHGLLTHMFPGISPGVALQTFQCLKTLNLLPTILDPCDKELIQNVIVSEQSCDTEDGRVSHGALPRDRQGRQQHQEGDAGYWLSHPLP